MKRDAAVLFALAVALNYAWELAQTPFYGDLEFPSALGHCFVAALGDGLLVLLLFAGVAAVIGSAEWYRHPSAWSYCALALLGLAVGFAVEWWGLHVARRWHYSDLMPVIPGTTIGAVPVLQMLLLPPVVYLIARRLVRWR